MMYGCKKEPVDYRTKFLGNYTFNVHYTSYWGWPPNTGSIDTTYTYNGTVVPGSEKETVLISFSNNQSFERAIYEEGSMENYFPYFSGEFESENKIKFHIWNHTLGYNYYYDITGEKK